MVDTSLLLIIIGSILGISLLAVCFFYFIKFRNKKFREKSKFNNVYIGMSENELLSLLGVPKTIFNVDNYSKVVTYVDSKFDLLFFLYTLTAQISIKEGIVTNIKITNK